MPETLLAPPPTTPAPQLKAMPAPVKPAPSPLPAKPDAIKPAPSKSRMEQAGDDMAKFAEKPVSVAGGEKKPESPEKPTVEAGKGDEKATASTVDSDTAKAGDDKGATAEPKKEGKVWKILKETEIERDKLKQEFEAFKVKATVDPEKEKATTEKLTAYEKREKELIEELRFHNYEKYDQQFQKDFHKPYLAAWERGVKKISQLPVILEDGTTRAGTATDLSMLMSLSPVQRHETAERMFGKYADAVIREAENAEELLERRQAASDEAKATLGQKEKERTEQRQHVHKAMSEEASRVWKEADAEAFSHEKYGKYFTPLDSDQEGNQRLAKGRALAERAFSENPFNPQISPSERATIVRRQNAVCNRAAAFGRLVSWNSKLESENAALKKELAQFNASDPGQGEGKSHDGNGAGNMTAQARSEFELSKLAR